MAKERKLDSCRIIKDGVITYSAIDEEFAREVAKRDGGIIEQAYVKNGDIIYKIIQD